MRFCSCFLLGMSLAAATPAQAPTAARNVLPFKTTETTLPNGLRVVVVPTGFPNIVAIRIPVQTGSRNEVEPGRSGFAHFFEHLMFRGTPSTPPETHALNLISGLSFKVVLKGYGPAFFQTGHTVYNLQTGEVLFAAGHNQNFDADFAALCNAEVGLFAPGTGTRATIAVALVVSMLFA